MQVYINAKIFTGADDAFAEAMVVNDGIIQYVGHTTDALASAGPRARIVDLAGRVVLPGFIDAHCHLLMLGEALQSVQLTDARSVGAIQERLRSANSAAPHAGRLIGSGWLFDAIPGGHPTAAIIDAAVRDVPVYLTANDYHSCWVNTAALNELGVTANTPDPLGGTIGRNVDGTPNGVLYETAAHQLAWDFLTSVQTNAERDAAIELALNAYASAGVTAVVDMALNQPGLDALRRVADARGGELPIMVIAHWLVENSGDAEQNLASVDYARALAEETSHSSIRVAGIKPVLDGTIDACTAAMGTPYTNGQNGALIWPLADLEPVVAHADAAGLQIAMHAIGDLASDTALDALDRAHELNGPRPRRHRIEHLEYSSTRTPARMAQLGVVASMQPVHADPAIWDNWAMLLGDERAAAGFAWNAFVDAGAELAISTDAPTAPHLPLHNLYVATTRSSSLDPSLSASPPPSAMTLRDAIGYATARAAYSANEDARRGKLVAGLSADFVVLTDDPFEEGASVLLTDGVALTVSRGEVIAADASLGGRK